MSTKSTHVLGIYPGDYIMFNRRLAEKFHGSSGHTLGNDLDDQMTLELNMEFRLENLG